MGDRTDGPRRLTQWLRQTGGGTSAKILNQASRLAQLTRTLERQLPTNLQGRWQLAKVEPGALVLVAESPAWAAQLRFAQHTLLETVEQALGFRPRTVQVRSNGYRPLQREKPRQKRT
ncbi:hypothetical protein CAI21_06905 [Alkalilimnicola ehrlichii]|uniref:DUF721 domain-containing protein n=1 Tax=Alkalilimnicola ehrlichii TaxID=351052 RepID=A0A3E0WY19_9GAMM|nr:DUF721 domain-containing protein [Alkalilimnicola ehrlichii]RFA30330.1 hypothetical protein CAI21_06905 [Alkalilimnicola ehrlichii]RFA37904.1 hypothetical protein CAL65_08250 [Alkalilimnicola ehrlichii]